MKILLVNDMAAPLGGAEILTLKLRDELRARGHDARLFSSVAGSDANSCLADYTCFGTTSGLRTLNRVLNPSAAWQLRRVLRQFKPDVAHVRMFLTQLSPAILPVLRSVPSLYHATWYAAICPIGLKLLPDNSICTDQAGIACYRQGCLSAQAWGPLMLQMKLWRRWRSAFKLIVANSHTVRRSLVDCGIEPVEVVWNGVEQRPRRPPLASPPTASYAGRLSWEKGVEVLVQAFGQVLKQVPDARLLLVGDGPDRQQLEQLTKDLNAHNNVAFLGHLPPAEMERQLAASWVHVVPSRLAEPFGLATAEAMMRGTAVIASDLGGPAEIVQHGQTGLCVPPSDPDRLAEALGGLLQAPDRAEQLGEAGYARAIAHFSLDAFVEKFIDLYQSLCPSSDRQTSSTDTN